MEHGAWTVESTGVEVLRSLKYGLGMDQELELFWSCSKDWGSYRSLCIEELEFGLGLVQELEY